MPLLAGLPSVHAFDGLPHQRFSNLLHGLGAIRQNKASRLNVAIYAISLRTQHIGGVAVGEKLASHMIFCTLTVARSSHIDPKGLGLVGIEQVVWVVHP